MSSFNTEQLSSLALHLQGHVEDLEKQVAEQDERIEALTKSFQKEIDIIKAKLWPDVFGFGVQFF